MNRNKGISIFGVNILFMLTNILFITIGSYLQNINFFPGSLVTEILLILIPSMIFMLYTKKPIRETLRLNRISFAQSIRVIVITIFTYPIAVFFQAIFIGIISIFKELSVTEIPMPTNTLEFMITFLVIAVVPGFCEEFMFRGVIMAGYKDRGEKEAIIISSFLFAMMHMTLANFIGPFFLGIIFGIMATKTNSLYSAILGHTVSNSIALIIGYIIEDYNNSIYVYSPLLNKEPITVVTLFLILVFVSSLLVYYLIGGLEDETKKIYRLSIETEYKYEVVENEGEDILVNNKFLIYSPVLVIIIIFIYRNFNYILN